MGEASFRCRLHTDVSGILSPSSSRSDYPAVSVDSASIKVNDHSEFDPWVCGRVSSGDLNFIYLRFI